MRIYQSTPIEEGMRLSLDARASHHIAHVLRAKIGDHLYIFNPESNCHGEFSATIIAIQKRVVIVEIAEFEPRQVESSLDISLAQSLVTREKMDWIIQKSVELGVKKIIPILAERSQIKWDSNRANARMAHWQGVATHACEQSGRIKIPTISSPLSLPMLLEQNQSKHGFVLSPGALSTNWLKEIYPSITVLIGPEGGLTRREIELAKAHRFIEISLGPRILRTETAAIMAIGLCQFQYGDLSKNFT